MPIPARVGSPRGSRPVAGRSTRVVRTGPTSGWSGFDSDDLVIYELHVGTFSAARTFDGVVEHLAELRALGVTAIELMPIATFPGDAQLGLRRRLHVRATPSLRRPDDSPGSSTPPSARARA